jgi:hydroxymethylpyrimidine/phosphomethylpyrimidine kinase
LPGDVVSDLLWLPGGEKIWLEDARIATLNTHGTGCTLSSAIAAGLALGQDLPQAVRSARAYVRAALEAGAQVRTGHGSGPLNHGQAPHAMHRLDLVG